ncbi:MAG: serine protease [Gammaproteobacteria bacterium]|nr:serine protease [Gammaproteobacteria bacterium]
MPDTIVDETAAELDQELSKRARIPVLVHISGSRRGTTERLSGETLRIEPTAQGSVAIVSPDQPSRPDCYAILHPAGETYELAVAEGRKAWVNGEEVKNRVLESGDLLEIGRGGPVLRYRLYAPGTQIYKSVREAFTDCVDGARRDHRGFLGRAAVFSGTLAKELSTQTTIWFRVGVLILLAMLVVTTILLTRHSLSLEEHLAQEQARVSSLVELIERTQSEAFDREELTALRAELESGISATAERVEALEARSAATRRVIAVASQSTLFVQGSFGFNDPESGRPLRLLIGPTGQPLRTPQGRPAVTLEGEGPEVAINYTGTAFLANPNGLLLTNRHVALPWEDNETYKDITALGLVPKIRRLIGYLSGVEEPFDIKLVIASDTADLALLRCADVTGLRTPLNLDPEAPQPGDEVIVVGYPTGIRALLARAGKAFLDELADQEDLDFWAVARHLAKAGHINPLATRGIVGQVTADAVVYDAETTQGGSGGPVLGLNGEVIAINTAILPEFGGSNLGVPVQHAIELFAQSQQ